MAHHVLDCDSLIRSLSLTKRLYLCFNVSAKEKRIADMASLQLHLLPFSTGPCLPVPGSDAVWSDPRPSARRSSTALPLSTIT
ncbi:S-adenosyl-L-methionine-dependent methyltransferases superfamily protein [Prunus dulcis]|uniref:S-adenosyl-L-methionine-dependent methyltransferases superfamily protein n=1 Tax=Prunus dulcis TaxID=3755 RepID=A0A4Y1QQB6_PRUDU|nr:S-adenosyl-L-methionine-dependent methyltransferases superfamily protein [Prunus dulcis]